PYIVLSIITARSARLRRIEQAQDCLGLLHVLLLQLGGQRQFLLRCFPLAQAGVTQTQVIVRLVRVGSDSRRLLERFESRLVVLLLKQKLTLGEQSAGVPRIAFKDLTKARGGATRLALFEVDDSQLESGLR